MRIGTVRFKIKIFIVYPNHDNTYPLLSNKKSNESESYSFPKAKLKWSIDIGLEEYQNNYKHRLSNFSSFDVNRLGNYSFDKQIGRSKMFLKTK